MFFKTAFIFSLAVSALALPASSDSRRVKRADVLKSQSYADFQVSDGVAGNALAEVNANFPVSIAPDYDALFPLWLPIQP